jgi:hypothetical protein
VLKGIEEKVRQGWVAYNDLYFVAGELSGGDGVKLRVNSIVLCYLPLRIG